jgi:hypothetical protein
MTMLIAPIRDDFRTKPLTIKETLPMTSASLSASLSASPPLLFRSSAKIAHLTIFEDFLFLNIFVTKNEFPTPAVRFSF